MLAELDRGIERTCFRVADLFEQIDDRYRGLRRVTRACSAHGEKRAEAAALEQTAQGARGWT